MSAEAKIRRNETFEKKGVEDHSMSLDCERINSVTLRVRSSQVILVLRTFLRLAWPSPLSRQTLVVHKPRRKRLL
jgi:hypothetical protein